MVTSCDWKPHASGSALRQDRWTSAWRSPHPLDHEYLPGRPAHHEITPVPRQKAGAHLAETVKQALTGLVDESSYLWIACDTTTIRAPAGRLRASASPCPKQLHALGYWRAA
ncbi:SIP domain-containing protein [Streptomyces sp. HUAS MG47]|uniref:SIP domain-containing protein n=1 Tax=Streptomyces solicamelliae TaxID=3231716 RepID=UPI003877BD72